MLKSNYDHVAAIRFVILYFEPRLETTCHCSSCTEARIHIQAFREIESLLIQAIAQQDLADGK